MISDLDAIQPARAVGVGVDELGGFGECFVDIEDLAADRRIDIRDSFDRLDGSEDIFVGDGLIGFRGEVEVYDITKLILCVIRDPHQACFGVDPFVVFGITEVSWKFHGLDSSCANRPLLVGGVLVSRVAWVWYRFGDGVGVVSLRRFC